MILWPLSNDFGSLAKNMKKRPSRKKNIRMCENDWGKFTRKSMQHKKQVKRDAIKKVSSLN